MRIIIQKNYEEMCQWVSLYIKEKIIQQQEECNNQYVLGLLTGSTPIGVYKNFVKYYKEKICHLKMLQPLIWMSINLPKHIMKAIIILCMIIYLII